MDSYSLYSAQIFIVLVNQCIAEICSVQYSNFYYTIHCSSGCCGSLYERECCDSLDAGVIAGIAVGSVVAFCIIVSVVICIVCNCCRKSQGQPGAIIQSGPSVTILNSTNQGQLSLTCPQYQQLTTTVDSQGILHSNTDYSQPPPPYEEFG